MSKLRFVGLDVHKEFVMVAVADDGPLPAEAVGRVASSPAAVLATLRRLGRLKDLRCCYEAGPTGYELQRYLADAGVDCVVVAPSAVPSQGVRIKTDRRDANRLARFLRSGDLTPIAIPTAETEAIRDLERARDDARLAERTARQQLLKFFDRHGRHFTEGKEHWTKTHWAWIRRQKFDYEAQQRVLSDAINTAEQAADRRTRLDQDISDCVESWDQRFLVKDLQAFRGMRELTAVGLIAEIGDFSRFTKASSFMAYVGLVPSESSSGNTRRQGGITKTGNRHVRRLLVEAAWHYYGSRIIAPSDVLRKRREGVPVEVVQIADRAIRRLRRKAYRLQLRKKSATQIVTAMARELAGFIWDAAQTSATARKSECAPIKKPRGAQKKCLAC